MNQFIFERVDSIRFERKFDDGSKASFTVGEPKTLKLENADYLITVGDPPTKLNELLHRWDSVFDPNTQIIISGEIHEVTQQDRVINKVEGNFDFRELCKGKMVCIDHFEVLNL